MVRSRQRFVGAALALILLAACRDGDGVSPRTTAGRSTTTSSTTATTSSTSTTSTTSPTPTSVAATTTASVVPKCASRAAVGGVAPIQAPAPGTYRYLRCASGVLAYDLAVGAGPAANQRTIGWTASFGSVTGLNSYDTQVTQASALVRLKDIAATLQCTWDNPLVIYPTALAMNSSWRTDGRCNMDFLQSLQFNRFSRVTGMRTLTVAGQSVRVVLVEETTDLLYVNSPRRNSTSWHSESTILFDPNRGLPVYERRISEATGQYPQAKVTTEVVLSAFSGS